MSALCVIVGSGGHASVLIEAMRLQGEFEPCCATDEAPDRLGSSLLDVPIVHGDHNARRLLDEGVTHFAIGMGAVRRSERRRELYELYGSMGFAPAGVIHPSAVLSPSAQVGEGLAAFAGSIVSARAVLGENVVLNTGCIVEHDCRIDSHVFVAPGVKLAGCVEVGQGSFLGLGATVIQGVRIGRGAVIGAGSVVLRDVEEGETAVGLVSRRSPR